MCARHIRLSISVAWAVFVLAAHSSASAQTCTYTAEGLICTQQQPLVAASLVDVQTQRELGLVTVSNLAGTCSGTLVNRFWVLTADHCATTDGTIGGPTDFTATVSAAWTTRTAVPSRLVRLIGGKDVALLFLGRGDLGPANVQLFFPSSVDVTQTITKYGRGIYQYATGAGPMSASPSKSDGLYRSAEFTPSAVSDDVISVAQNASGQMVAGGDSGGPDIVTSPEGIRLGIAGVASTCSNVTYVPGMNQTWIWATGASACSSVNLDRLRVSILMVISEAAPRASDDFDDDNHPDIVWHNDLTGETQVWLMRNGSRIARVTVQDEYGNAILVGWPWRIVGSRNFDGDHWTDLLWYNEATGELQVWLMNGTRIRSRATVVAEDGRPTFIGPPWQVAGANDMNGDGFADIVWHNNTTGETQLWFMSGTQIAARATVRWDNTGTPALVGWPFSIVATDDFNWDGYPDILWHNDLTGETQIWYMAGDRLIGRRTVTYQDGWSPAYIGWPFRIVGTKDFDGDGQTDILWHNEWTGETQIWFMAAYTLQRTQSVDATLDSGGAYVGWPWAIVPH